MADDLMNDHLIWQAIEQIIQDTDEIKYDKSIFDKFLANLVKLKLNTSSPILKGLSKYIDCDHEAFAKLNKVRAIQIFNSSYWMTPAYDKFDELVEYLDVFWRTFSKLIKELELDKKQDEETLKASINMLVALTCHGRSYTWLLKQKFIPKINYQGIEIEDVTSFLRYLIRTNSEFASELFKSLVVDSFLIEGGLSTHQRALENLQCAIRDAIIDERTLFLIDQTLEALRWYEYSIDILPVDIRKTLRDNIPDFETVSNLLDYCKCLGMTANEDTFLLDIEKLLPAKSLDGIIVYISNSKVEHDWNTLARTYLLYPLLYDLRGIEYDKKEEFLQKLSVAKDHIEFIEQNINYKIVEFCPRQLKYYLDSMTPDEDYPDAKTKECAVLILFNYIEYNRNFNERYGQVRECRKALDRLLFMYTLDEETINEQLLYRVYNCLLDSSIEFESSLIDMVAVARIIYQKLVDIKRMKNPEYKMDSSFIEKMVELAFKYENPEVLGEFVEFFYVCQMDFEALPKDLVRNYVKLICEHIPLEMQVYGRKEIPDYISTLLTRIYNDVDESLIKEFNIKSHHDIPSLIKIKNQMDSPDCGGDIQTIGSLCALANDILKLDADNKNAK